MVFVGGGSQPAVRTDFLQVQPHTWWVLRMRTPCMLCTSAAHATWTASCYTPPPSPHRTHHSDSLDVHACVLHGCRYGADRHHGRAAQQLPLLLGGCTLRARHPARRRPAVRYVLTCMAALLARQLRNPLPLRLAPALPPHGYMCAEMPSGTI